MVPDRRQVPMEHCQVIGAEREEIAIVGNPKRPLLVETAVNIRSV